MLLPLVHIIEAYLLRLLIPLSSICWVLTGLAPAINLRVISYKSTYTIEYKTVFICYSA